MHMNYFSSPLNHRNTSISKQLKLLSIGFNAISQILPRTVNHNHLTIPKLAKHLTIPFTIPLAVPLVVPLAVL